jgi:hypothetical protein
MNRIWSALLTFGLMIVPVFAQEGEVRFGSVTTKKATVLKSQPRNLAANLQTVPAGTSLQWVERQKRGHWLRILVPKGSLGWVDENAVDIAPGPPPGVEASTIPLAATKCAAILSVCPADGCEHAGSAHAAMNQAKRTFATGQPITITFADLHLLQAAADAVVTQGQDIPDRSVIRDLQIDAGRSLGEGTAVQMTVFLAAGPEGPHPNTGESVNRNLKGSANNDFHIPVTESHGETEFDGVVTEMIPQGAASGSFRKIGWTLLKLQSLRTSQRQTKIVGGLFYDNAHVVNPDPQNPIASQPKRFSLWEIHPIAQFLVCKRPANNCLIDTDSDWTPLETFK